MYTEYYKQQQPSMSAEEIQQKLVNNNVCLAENVPSSATITRALHDDLGYSYKQLNVTVRESLTENVQDRLTEYLTACSTIDARSMHFLTNVLSLK